MKPRILALYLPTSPSAGSLPDLAKTLLALSPRVGIRPPDTLYVDIAPTLHLFGGEEGILKKIGRTHVAIADDLATAGLLARHVDQKPIVVPAGKSAEALAPLPVNSLRFLVNPLSPPTPHEARNAEELLRVLSLLGIRTLGEFARIPAAGIGPRFGEKGVELHRLSRGTAEPLLRPFETKATYRESWEFEDPISIFEPLLFIAKNLLTRLEQRMQKDLSSALEMTLYLETEEGKETSVSIPLHRPLRKSNILFDIVRERLGILTMESALRSIAIEISAPVRSRGSQFHLFDAHELSNERLDELLGRLVGKLGPTIVSAAVLRERHRPETTWKKEKFEPMIKPATSQRLPETDGRPTLLLASPKELRVQKSGGQIVFHSSAEKFVVSKLHGPERLQGEWWSPNSFSRDYFVAETQSGQQLWIFKSLTDQKVFLHGYFD